MKERIRGLDGLKGIIAIFIAYVYHYSILFYVNPFESTIVLDKVFNAVNIYTGYSEAVFFLISGFMMAYVYEERIPHMNVREFFWPRIKKLYPLMIATVLVVFALENLGKILMGRYTLHGANGDVQYGAFSLVASCLGVQTGYFSDGDLHSVNGPAWFISILFLCYLISYLILKYVGDKRIRDLLFFFMFFLGVVISWNGGFDIPLLYSCCGRGYVGFFLGYLMEKNVDRKKGLPVWKVLLFVAEIIFVLYLTEDVLAKYRMILTELFVYPITVYLVLKLPKLQHLLDKKIPRYFGRISMYMYLLNYPIFVGVVFLNRGLKLGINYLNPWTWVVITALSIGISTGVYHLMTKPWKSQR